LSDDASRDGFVVGFATSFRESDPQLKALPWIARIERLIWMATLLRSIHMQAIEA
jgi:hypothetical protein